MVPSPRKRAPRTSFNQTWDGTDAASLDPASLPIVRIPRGWERKQETKKTEEGREKKIWRRFGLRSRAPDVDEEVDDEEHDVRSRAVKKQQHMSPKAMEKSTGKANGKRRTFKATRWDRRKSVLPRKKSSRIEDPETLAQEAADESDDNEEAQDVKGGDLSEENISMVEPAVVQTVEHVQHILPDGESRRGTFTFSVEEEAYTVDELSNHIVGDAEETPTMTTAEDATITRLFQSPVKEGTASPHTMTEEVDYPELPLSDREDAVPDIVIEPHQDTGVPSIHADEAATRQEADIAKEECLEMTMAQHAPSEDAESEEMEVEQELQAVATPIRVEEKNVMESTEDVAYPALPTETLTLDSVETSASSRQQAHTKSAEVTEETYEEVDDQKTFAEDAGMLDAAESSDEEDFTEASLQLDILRDYQDTLRGRQLVRTEATDDDEEFGPEDMDQEPQNQQPEVATPAPAAPHAVDITDGLTLSFTPLQSTPAAPTPRQSQSPAPPVYSAAEDATMTIALDDDTALLKSFLSRAAASKAEKAAVTTHRRESLQNRRDSDVVRHALASPRKALEEKDPNSPSKQDNELMLDLSQNVLLNMNSNGLASATADDVDQDDAADEKSLHSSRRSSRTKKSRLPAPASASATPVPAQTSKISIRRPDGTDHVVLKKSDAQELALLTKANTRKNKQGAFGVTVRLLKLAVDAAGLPPLDDSTRELVVGKNIRWDEQLAYYQENPETVAEAESLATPDELGMPDAPTAKKSKVSKNSTPKIRRVRGLGTANGTPGKVLLAPASLLPEEVQEEKEASHAPTQQLPKPKTSKIKKMPVASSSSIPGPTTSDTKLPSLDIAPVGVTPTKPRTSRLAAPKKVVLPQPSLGMPAEGKENAQRTGISSATPKKGIPAPKVNVPQTVGMESGLPRRRGRKI